MPLLKSTLTPSTVIVENMDTAINVAKNNSYTFRIITLEGDLINPSGAITGGTKNNNGNLNQKFELESLEKDLSNKKGTIKELNKKIETDSSKYNKLLEKINVIEKDILILRETIGLKENTLKELETTHNTKSNELNGTQNIVDNNLDKELDNILKEYYKKAEEKEQTTKELTKLKNQKSDLSTEINELENAYREYNYRINIKQNELKNEEIKASKLDVKLDNLLLSLNENYNLTYERASNEYTLDIEEGTARLTVSNLKARIKELGEVNTGSIAEYERLETRYNFLDTQKNDLEISVTDSAIFTGNTKICAYTIFQGMA